MKCPRCAEPEDYNHPNYQHLCVGCRSEDMAEEIEILKSHRDNWKEAFNTQREQMIKLMYTLLEMDGEMCTCFRCMEIREQLEKMI